MADRDVAEPADSDLLGPQTGPSRWVSPDGSFVKTVLEPGSGLDKPGEGSRCRVEVAWEEAGPECGELPLDGAGEVVVGEADTEPGELLERCLESMLPGERCQARLGTGACAGLTCSVRLEGFDRPGGSWRLSSEEKWDWVRRHREVGNELYRAGEVTRAARRYAKALRLLVTLRGELPAGREESEYEKDKGKLHANLAAAQIKTGQHANAVRNCTKALEAEPGSVKCLYRRGLAQAALRHFGLAREDLREALRLEPGNSAVRRELRVVRERLRVHRDEEAGAMSKLFT
uniref:FKBP prolyl isomerase like n=1 Tax=Callorhinchus milii TaxID=7868 RepID=V9L258_CALMI|eukprot:gi/632991158/ref/XP_007884500.1/ PREDICTED: FK506-binding protein-like [Callorhinchus milii]